MDFPTMRLQPIGVRVRRGLLSVVAAGSALCPVVARASFPMSAQDAARSMQRAQSSLQASHDAAQIARPSREVGEHYFIPSRFTGSPLVTTNLGMTTGAGFAGIASSGQSGAEEHEFRLAALSQSAGFQLAITRFWAVRVGASSFLFSGVDRDSVLAFGSSFGYLTSLGTTLAVRLGRLLIAPTLDVALSDEFGFDALGTFERGVEDRRVDPSDLLARRRVATASNGLHAVIGLGKLLGARGSVEQRSQHRSGAASVQRRGEIRLGGAVDLDLSQTTPVPLGFLAAYGYVTGMLEVADAAPSHEIATGLFYTGRRDLLVGVEGRMTRQELPRQLRLNVYQALLEMRYFWRAPGW